MRVCLVLVTLFCLPFCDIQGWEDAPLAEDGVSEAREAGKLLKAHGFQVRCLHKTSRYISHIFLPFSSV